MLAGWTGVLILLLILSISAHNMSTAGWLCTLMMVQGCLMLSDVPADGYAVELGQYVYYTLIS